MAEIVAIGFKSLHEADRVLVDLGQLQSDVFIDLDDVVLAVRYPDGRVRLKQSIDVTTEISASAGLSGATWGKLVSLLLLKSGAMDAVGGSRGAGADEFLESFHNCGIDAGLSRSLAETLEPSGSALFVLVRRAQPEQILEKLSSSQIRVARFSITPVQETMIQKVFFESMSAYERNSSVSDAGKYQLLHASFSYNRAPVTRVDPADFG